MYVRNDDQWLLTDPYVNEGGLWVPLDSGQVINDDKPELFYRHPVEELIPYVFTHVYSLTADAINPFSALPGKEADYATEWTNIEAVPLGEVTLGDWGVWETVTDTTQTDVTVDGNPPAAQGSMPTSTTSVDYAWVGWKDNGTNVIENAWNNWNTVELEEQQFSDLFPNGNPPSVSNITMPFNSPTAEYRNPLYVYNRQDTAIDAGEWVDISGTQEHMYFLLFTIVTFGLIWTPVDAEGYSYSQILNSENVQYRTTNRGFSNVLHRRAASENTVYFWKPTYEKRTREPASTEYNWLAQYQKRERVGTWSAWLDVTIETAETGSSTPPTDPVNVPANTASVEYRNPQWVANGNQTVYSDWSAWLEVSGVYTQTTTINSPPGTAEISLPTDTETAQYTNPNWTANGTSEVYGNWSSWLKIETGQTYGPGNYTSLPESYINKTPDTDTEEYTNWKWNYHSEQFISQSYWYVTVYKRTRSTNTVYNWVGNYDKRTRSASTVYQWDGNAEKRELMGDWSSWLVTDLRTEPGLSMSTEATTSYNNPPSTTSFNLTNTSEIEYRNPEWVSLGSQIVYGDWGVWSDFDVTNQTTATNTAPTSAVTLPADTSTTEYTNGRWVSAGSNTVYGSWSAWTAVSSGDTQSTSSNSAPSTSGISVPTNTLTEEHQNPHWVSNGTSTSYSAWSDWGLHDTWDGTTSPYPVWPGDYSPDKPNDTDTKQYQSFYTRTTASTDPDTWQLVSTVTHNSSENTGSSTTPPATDPQTYTGYATITTGNGGTQDKRDSFEWIHTGDNWWQVRFKLYEGRWYYTATVEERSRTASTNYNWSGYYDRRTRSSSNEYYWNGICDRRTRTSSTEWSWYAQAEKRVLQATASNFVFRIQGQRRVLRRLHG